MSGASSRVSKELMEGERERERTEVGVEGTLLAKEEVLP